MRIDIQGLPEFRFTLTRGQMDVLLELSSHHYDGVCRDASRNGFLHTWDACMQNGGHDYSHRATWRELDTCLKIMEMTSGCTVAERMAAHRLFIAFNHAMSVAQSRMHGWNAVSITE